MKITERLRAFFLRNTVSQECVQIPCSVIEQSPEFVQSGVIQRLNIANYKSIHRDNGAILMYRLQEDDEDLTAIEIMSTEVFSKIDIENEIASMGDEFTRQGLDIEVNKKRRIALLIVADTITEKIIERIKDATYEEPIGFPPQSCYNLSICACIDLSSDHLFVSPRTEILKKEWRVLVDEIVESITKIGEEGKCL